jgi:hypothetical protein
MDGIWAKYWFIVIWPIEAWSAYLFTRIRAFTSHRLRERNGLRSQIAKGISKYHQSLAEYVSTLLYSFVIASLISASRIAREAASPMLPHFMSKVPQQHNSLTYPYFSFVIVLCKMLVCRYCQSPVLTEVASHCQMPSNVAVAGHQLPVESIHLWLMYTAHIRYNCFWRFEPGPDTLGEGFLGRA